METSGGDDDVPLVGRADELKTLLERLNAIQTGSGARMVLVSGESGVGKTRLCEDLLGFASQLGFRQFRSKCLNDAVTPYLPVFDALRGGGLGELASFESPPKVMHILAMSPEGLVMSQQSRAEKLKDMDIFSGMLAAVGTFVKDSMDRLEVSPDQPGTLNSMGYGNYRILIETRSIGSLVVILSGVPTEMLMDDIKEAMERIEAELGPNIREWKGDVRKVEGIKPLLEPFFSRYDGQDYVKEPKDRQWRLFENVSKGLRRTAQESPVIFFLDDIHWADPSSLALIHSMLKSCINDRLLVLGTFRKDELMARGQDRKHFENAVKSMEREGFLEHLVLERLDKKATRLLVAEVLGGIAQGPLGDMIIKDTKGNPLFVLELIDYLKYEGILEWEENGFVVTGSLQDVGLPARTRDIIKNRLDKLPEEYRDILEAASVMGEVFFPLALSNALDLNRLQFLKTLRKIQDGYGLIREMPDGKGAYIFDHFKVRDFLYGQIPKDMRTEYHRLIADSLSNQLDQGDEMVLEDLAKHAHLGRHRDRVSYCIKAGDKAREEFNNNLAKEFYSWALESAEEADHAAITESLGEVFFQEGDNEEAEEWFKMALQKSRTQDSRVLLASKLALAYDRQGRANEALKIILVNPPDEGTHPLTSAKWRAVKAWIHYRNLDFPLAEREAGTAINELGESGGEEEDIAHCWNTLASVKYGEGRLGDAAKFYKNGISVVRAKGASVIEASLLNNLSLCERGLGRFSESLDLGMEALTLSRKLGNRFYEAVSLNRIGNIQLFYGKYDMAIDTLTRGLDISLGIGANPLSADFLQLRAKCYLNKQMYGKARADVSEAILNCFDSPDFLHFTNQTLIEVLVAQGEFDQALAKAREEIVQLQKKESKYYYAIGLRNLALALWKKGERTGAETAFRACLVDLRDQMHAYEYALGLRLWGEALAQWGEMTEAGKKLTEARDKFQGMDAGGELIKVEAALQLLGEG